MDIPTKERQPNRDVSTSERTRPIRTKDKTQQPDSSRSRDPDQRGSRTAAERVSRATEGTADSRKMSTERDLPWHLLPDPDNQASKEEYHLVDRLPEQLPEPKVEGYDYRSDPWTRVRCWEYASQGQLMVMFGPSPKLSVGVALRTTNDIITRATTSLVTIAEMAALSAMIETAELRPAAEWSLEKIAEMDAERKAKEAFRGRLSDSVPGRCYVVNFDGIRRLK